MKGRAVICASAAPGLVLACAAVLLASAAPRDVLADITPDSEDTVYATGAVFATKEELADKPRTPLFRNYLPPFVDLSHRFPIPGNQGGQGSCVGWAVGYGARSYYNSAPQAGPRLRADQIPSPAYIYDSIRPVDTSCKFGTRIPDALDRLKLGALSLAAYPYDERRCRSLQVTALTRTDKFRIADWQVVNTRRLDQVKAELAKGHPVVIGMLPNREFNRLRGREIWRAGPPSVDEMNGHAVTVVGYSERDQYFVIINSWGRGWGDRGFGRISYDTFRKRVREGYSMRLEEKPPPPKPKPPPPKPKPPPPKPKPVPPKPKPEPRPDPTPPAPIVPVLRLPEIGCGRVAIEKRKGKTFVVGFVGTRDDLAKVKQAAAKSNANAEIDLRPWPQCEALMTIEEPLGEPNRPSVFLPKSMYQASETLAFDVRMAGFQGYLHVAYIQADGNVVNLVQSDPLALSTLPAHTKLRFGDGRDGRSKFTIGAPFGNEMILTLASKSPLFDEDRPLVETERKFLTALRKAIIARPDPTLPKRIVAASFVVLETTRGE